MSGGGDSTALLLLLKDHLDREAPDTRLLAVTVDHGLRPEAAAEADAVASLCAERAIPHRIVAWTEPKPASGLQEAAREARHRLLADVATESGTDLVATGHTRDDLIETVLMRETRGEGLGSAGIAPATLYDRRIWFARPLLGTSREALRSFLVEQRVAWLDDPSNSDRRFERVRVRQALSTGRADAEPVAERAAAAAARRKELGGQAAELISRHAETVSPGLLRLSRDMLAGEQEPAVHAFRVLAAAAGGAWRLPDEPRSAALLARLGATGTRATLAGAVVTSRRDGIYLHREFRGAGPEPAQLGPGMIWDGRYEVIGSVPHGLSVAPLGRCRPPLRSTAQSGVGAVGNVPRGLAAAALAAEPTFLEGDQSLSRERACTLLRPVVSPFARFLPSFDLQVAQAAAKLLGAAFFPAPPFTPAPRPGHNRSYA